MAKYNYEFKPVITDFDIDWMKIKSACMTTISKQAGSKEPNEEWKKKLLMCQHSPLRRGSISWKWEEIPYCISTHFVRHHEGVEKWIGTSRADRTEIKDRSERTQMDMVPMEMEANIQALINISERRLCTCADPLTIKYWKGVLEAVREFDEDIYWACVPQCIRMGACPEAFSPCGFFEKFAEAHPDLCGMDGVPSEKPPFTNVQMFELGLTGRDNSAALRDEVCRKLGLPAGMSAKAFAEAVGLVSDFDEIEKIAGEL